MEINHQLLDQMLNVKKVVDSVRPEFRSISRARASIERAGNWSPGKITVFLIFLCCLPISKFLCQKIEDPFDQMGAVLLLSLGLTIIFPIVLEVIKVKIYESKIKKNQNIINKQFENTPQLWMSFLVIIIIQKQWIFLFRFFQQEELLR